MKHLIGHLAPSHRATPQWRGSVRSTLAFFAVAAFVAVPLAGPSTTVANAWFEPGAAAAQSVLVTGGEMGILREEIKVSGGWGVAPAVGRPDPGSAQAIALDLVAGRAWSEAEYSCLVALWSKESGWNTFAHNSQSGAYGIPQSLPGSKMASAGDDWMTNPETQIRWGLGYIEARYGVPCEAWGHSQRRGWY